MTKLSRFMALWPTLHMAAAVAAFLNLVRVPGLGSLAGLAAAIYGLPLLAYRIHGLVHPVVEGISYLDRPQYSPWWGSHQLQSIFVGLPGLETVLRLVPGLFSLWLRAWGSAIGRGVYWTPGIEIADRGLLEIGEGAMFGHRVGMYSHVIKPRPRGLLLYVKKVRVEAGAFVGAGCHLGPGATIEAGVYVPAGTDIHPNARRSADGEAEKAGPEPGDEG